MKYEINSEAINFDFLESLPTLAQGHSSDLKADCSYIRLSLTRTGYEGIRQAFIEVFNGDEWDTILIVTQLLENGKWIDCSADIFDTL